MANSAMVHVQIPLSAQCEGIVVQALIINKTPPWFSTYFVEMKALTIKILR